MAGTHSILAPSGAHRWARCVGSLYMSKDAKDQPTEDAASGTCTHFIAECMLRAYASPQGGAVPGVGTPLEFDGFKFVVDADRIMRAESYVDRVNSEPGVAYVEKRLNTTPILGVPGQTGHADCIKVHENTLSIHDLKDGYGMVVAKDNLQGLIYLAAALYEYDLVHEIHKLRFCIHQPKLGHYDEHTYTRDEIQEFVRLIAPVAQTAYGIWAGDIPFDSEQHLTPGDDQCNFCPVRGSCVARARRIVAMFEPILTRHVLDDEALSAIVIRLDEIESAAKDFRAEAMKRALAGSRITGHKLVRGKRGARQWTDKEAAEKKLLSMLSNKKLAYEPAEIISPTAAEKRLGKANYKHIEQLVKQSDGSLHLARADDPREEYTVPSFGTVEESLI